MALAPLGKPHADPMSARKYVSTVTCLDMFAP